jgi:O-antigen/teichoic acid export membrane protein
VFVLADPLIRVWLGSKAEEVAGAIPVLQILTIAVAVRVGDATSTTLLKGTGKHKMLAGVNLATGAVNVALSAMFIGPFGLIGVAYGTLIPITIAAAFILFPAACRRVGLSTAHVAWHGIVPAVWPALPAAVAVWLLRDTATPTVFTVALQSIAGGLLYVVLFFGVAIGRRDRALYVQKARELIGRRSAAAPKAPAAGAVIGGQ